MFCPQCGLQNKDEAKFCQECGTRIVPEKKPPVSSKTDTSIGIIIILVMVLAFIWSISMMGVIHIPFFGKPSVHVADTEGVSFLGTAKIKFQIYNSGDGTANNVYANVQIINPDNLAVLQSKKVFVGNLAPGESKTMTTTISGNVPTDSKFRVILNEE